jgi:hypothetical protein
MAQSGRELQRERLASALTMSHTASRTMHPVRRPVGYRRSPPREAHRSPWPKTRVRPRQRLAECSRYRRATWQGARAMGVVWSAHRQRPRRTARGGHHRRRARGHRWVAGQAGERRRRRLASCTLQSSRCSAPLTLHPTERLTACQYSGDLGWASVFHWATNQREVLHKASCVDCGSIQIAQDSERPDPFDARYVNFLQQCTAVHVCYRQRRLCR